MAGLKKAFSLIELLLIVVFIGIFALIAVPRLNIAATSKQKADYLARKIVTDLRRTRRMAISDAANNSAGFSLNMVGAKPYSSYEIVNISTSATVYSHTIDSAVSCTGWDTFSFGPLGNLLATGNKTLTVSAEGKTFTITVTPATGMIKCSEN